MEKKYMTSVKISTDINNKMLHSVVEKNSSLRGKSVWIIDAIEQFLQMDGFEELVDIASEMQDLSESVSFRLPESVILQLDQAIFSVRKQFPIMEGVKSNIIRASIIQKLLRE